MSMASAKKKPPSAFVSACDKFVYTEVLRGKEDESVAIAKRSSSQLKQDTRLVSLLRKFRGVGFR